MIRHLEADRFLQVIDTIISPDVSFVLIVDHGQVHNLRQTLREFEKNWMRNESAISVITEQKRESGYQNNTCAKVKCSVPESDQITSDPRKSYHRMQILQAVSINNRPLSRREKYNLWNICSNMIRTFAFEDVFESFSHKIKIEHHATSLTCRFFRYLSILKIQEMYLKKNYFHF